MLPSPKTKATTDSAPVEAAPSRRLTLKKVLYHPLTWLAVGLHVLLLLVPLKDRQPADAPAEDEIVPEEEVAIDILNLSDITTSAPPPEVPPPEASVPVPPHLPVAAPPAAAPPPRQVVVVEPAPAQTPIGDATSEPVTQPPATQSPAFDPAPAQGVFISGLGNLGVADNTAVGMPDKRAFRRPENFEYFVNGADPVAAAKDARWLDDEPADLLPVIQSTYAQSNITFTQLDNYGGEPLYELTTDGQTILYMSIVALEGSSLLVMWEDNPLS
ncbi:MAG: hypothetical protein WBB01_17740 [Phormidesmis sp.]